MTKYFFEFQTIHQSLYSLNLLNIRFFKFDDVKKGFVLNSGGIYDSYLIDPATYNSLKENFHKI